MSQTNSRLACTNNAVDDIMAVADFKTKDANIKSNEAEASIKPNKVQPSIKQNEVQTRVPT